MASQEKRKLPPKDSAKSEPKSIKINSESAQLKHINQRHEGTGEEAILALDLKFECIARCDLLQALCGAEVIPDLWNEDGSVKFLGITGFTSRAELKECHFTFGDLIEEPIKISGVKANKFVFTPVGGHAVKLALRVQLRPSDSELLALTHATKKNCQLSIVSKVGVLMDDDKDQDLLEDQEQENDAE